MAKNKKQKQKIKKISINGWVALRDFMVAGLNKGQLPAATLSALVILFVWKMPGKDITPLIRDIFDRLVDLSLLGWLLFGISIIGWAKHSKAQRRWWSREIDRIAEERNKWQELAMKKKLGSSK